MRILVTGGAGFIGSNLSKRLIDEGHKVICIDNLSHGSMTNIESIIRNTNYTFYLSDLTQPGVLDVIKCDIIIHLASQKIPRYTNSYKTITENHQMAQVVIEKCIKDNIKLVFASTSDVYGKNTKLPFSETSDLVMGSPKVKRWAYSVSKIHTEHSIIANNEERGLTYTIMRFFGSYGVNQNTTWWGGPQSIFIQRIKENKQIEIHGTGEQTRTFTYIDDTVDGIIRCVGENANNEIFNIAGEPSEEISINNLALMIYDLMGVKPNIKYIPYYNFGNYEDVINRVPNIDKIKERLGFIPQWKLKEGLQNTIKWQLK